jgi:HSP20 family molecular chaperone IbpA
MGTDWCSVASVGSQKQTVEGNFYRPLTDIFESSEALTVVMEVPGVDRDKIEASVKDGVLTLALPKVKEATPQRIRIS